MIPAIESKVKINHFCYFFILFDDLALALDKDSSEASQEAKACALRLNELNKVGKVSRQEADSIFSALDGLRQSAIAARENAGKQMDNGKKLLEALWGFSARIDTSKARARGLLDNINSTFLRMQQAKAKLISTNNTIVANTREIADLTPTQEQMDNLNKLQQTSANLSSEATRLETLSEQLLNSARDNSNRASQLSTEVSDRKSGFQSLVSERVITATQEAEGLMTKLGEAETAVRELAIRLEELEKLSRETGNQGETTLPGLPDGTTQTLSELNTTLNRLQSEKLPEAKRRINDLENLKRETSEQLDLSQRAIEAGTKELARLKVVISALTTEDEGECFLAPVNPTK